MKRKMIATMIAVVALLFVCSFFTGAEHAIYINNAGAALRGLLSENYAIGSDGVQLLAYDDAYILTGTGVSGISSTAAEGGGGLLYEDGSVQIRSNIIKVGLSYNFNRADSDTTVDSAVFTNTSGGGFSFGYYDSGRRFVELASADHSTVLVAPIEPGSLFLGVYSPSGELLYQTNYANTRDNYLALHPVGSGAVQTRYLDYLYYGDFELGYSGGEAITVINTLDIERYVEGVIAVEMPASSGLEAYKAQAVAARTYAQRMIGVTDVYDFYGFDVTNNTYYQAYYGYYVPNSSSYSTISAAVEQTENQYLTYNGKIILAMFGAANGGTTVDGGQPYLKSFEDPYESRAWTRGMFGHGIGMSQWGAYSMARYFNKDYKSILGFYYAKVGISYGYC